MSAPLKAALLIMLPHVSFPKETGSLPEGHFHLAGKHTSIMCAHEGSTPRRRTRGFARLCPWARWLRHFSFEACHRACVCVSVSRRYQ